MRGCLGLESIWFQNSGRIESPGYACLLLCAPATSYGQILLAVNATHLSDYAEIVSNADGASTSNDLTGTRACFPCGVIGMSTVAHDLPERVGYA